MIQDIAWSPRLVGTTTATAASAADVTAGTSTSTFVTPAALAGSSPTFGGNLTVSGTGANYFEAGLTNPPSLGSNGGSIRLLNASSFGLLAGVSGTGNSWIQAQRVDGTALAYNLIFQAAGGNLLIGTTTDSANGKLQLATHTTSAGGIGFGADTSLFRSSAGVVQVYGTSANAVLSLTHSSTTAAKGFDIQIDGSKDAYVWLRENRNLYIGTNGTTALTLDSSQNATFAGAISVASGANYNKINLDRTSATSAAYLRWTTANAANWIIGTGATGNDTNLTLYSYGGGGSALTLNSTTGNATFSGSITTATPSGGTAGAWKLGIRVAATTTLDTTQYLQVDIGGTLYKVALVTS